MKRSDHIQDGIIFVISILLLSTAANAQIDFRRPGSMRAATAQRPETPQPPVRTAPNAEELNNALAVGLRDFVVEPDEIGAVIKFRAPDGSAPVLEIGTERPTTGQNGKLEFPTRLQLVPAEVVIDKRSLQQTNFKASVAGLERGTRYYYLVSTSSANLQTQGYFSTRQSLANVAIVYTEIEVTNDSDANSNGDLVFDFAVNKNRFSAYGSSNNLLNWSDDEPARQINESTQIFGVTETFDLTVYGCDDDSTIGPNGCGFRFDTSRPQSNWDSDTNLATQTFDIRDFPGKEVRHDFVLKSMRQGGGDGDLSFNVKGYFIVTRN